MGVSILDPVRDSTTLASRLSDAATQAEVAMSTIHYGISNLERASALRDEIATELFNEVEALEAEGSRVLRLAREVLNLSVENADTAQRVRAFLSTNFN